MCPCRPLHGFRGAEGGVEIIIHATRDVVEVRIKDCAPSFNPLLLPEPDLVSNFEKRQNGRVGDHLIRQVADEATYRYTGRKTS
jgi:anti-sigma regulatory factor (Ser/Thr protein kinase)